MMRSIVRRVVASLRRHLRQILGALVLLPILVVLWIFPAWPFEAMAVLQKHLIAAIVLSLGLLIFVLWGLPKWQASGIQDIKDRLTVENAARQTLAQIVGGMVLIAGLFFTWENLQITQRAATQSQNITREGQITDRFTKAIEQMGAVDQERKKKLEVRLGGIYALERIAKESEQDHWPIMEVLTAYVRENARWLPKDDQSPKEEPPVEESQLPRRLATDIQAVLTVLGRRTLTYGTGENQPLNLRGTDLRSADLEEALLERADLQGAHLEGAELQGAHLEKAQFQGAHLEKAQLQGAHLEKANLQGVHLEKANLWGAHLEKASLRGTHLEGAYLGGAYLEGAEFRGAHLKGADLREAHLEGARNLMVEQLSIVKTLYQAHLDPPLLEQIQQQYPQLLEKPQNMR